MPQDPIATLIQSNDPEGRDVTWQEVGQTPSKFLSWLIKRVAIDFSKITNAIPMFIGKNPPAGVDAGKVHFQDSDEPRVGIKTSQGYKYLDRYPRNVIMAWYGPSTVPSFFSTISDSEAEALGLPKNKPNSLVWVVYPE